MQDINSFVYTDACVRFKTVTVWTEVTPQILCYVPESQAIQSKTSYLAALSTASVTLSIHLARIYPSVFSSVAEVSSVLDLLILQQD